MRRVACTRPRGRRLLPISLSVVTFFAVAATFVASVSGADRPSGQQAAAAATGATGANGPSAPPPGGGGPTAPAAAAVDSHMQVANSPDFDYGTFSFEIWVKPPASYPFYQAIACNTLYPSTGWLLATDLNGGLIFQTGDGSGAQGWAKTATSLTQGQWNHVVALASGNSKSLYLNGALVATGAGTGSPSSQPFHVGGACGGLEIPSGFSFDQAAIYRRALSTAEVQARFASPDTPLSPGPLSSWRLDETNASQAAADNQGVHPGSYVNSPTLGIIGRLGTAMRNEPDAAAPTQPLEQTTGVCGAGSVALAACNTLSDPINTLTGAFTHAETDLTLASTGVPFELTRSYTSADPTVGRFGPGWTDNFAISLQVQPNGDVVAHGEEGQLVTFVSLGGGVFDGAAGARATLETIAGGYRLTRTDQVVFEFDTQGRLTSKKDRNGQGVSLAYDASGRLQTVTDAAGNTATFAYNANDLVSGVSLSDGRSVSYAYTAGRLTSFTDVRGKVWTYTYDAGGRLATIVDPLNHVQVSNVYDATSGRVTSQTDAVGKTTMFAWDAATQTATVTDPNQHVWKDVYVNNVLFKRIDGASNTTELGHDTDLNGTSVKGPTGETTTMSYDSAGNVLAATAPPSLGGVQKSFTYNANNDPLSVTDARGKVTSYTYTAAGNVATVTQDGVQVASYTYDGQGRVLTSTDGNGRTTAYTYDPGGNVASLTLPDADGPGPLGQPKTIYAYDGQGNLLTRVDPLGNVAGCGCAAQYTTTFTYNAAGQLLTETDPLGHVTTSVYDDAGRLSSTTDANNHTTSFAYDDADRLLSETGPDPDGAGPLAPPVTSFTYDNAGNKLTETDPRGNTNSFAYDAANRLVSTTGPDPDGAGSLTAPVTTNVYDANGNLVSTVEPRGNVAGANPADYRTSFTYDAAGRLLTTTDPLGSVTTNGYDAVGNLATVTDANSHVTSYTYDAAGRILTVTAPDPDGAGPLAAPVTTYTYDPVGNRLTRTDANNHVTTTAYDPLDRAASVTGPDPDGAGPQTPSVSTMAYDINGNLLMLTDANGNGTPTAGDGTTGYGYDRANRLTGIDYSDATPDVTFSLDNVGNRLSMVDGSGTESRSYDQLGRLLTVTRGSSTFSYLYDPAGNVTKRTYPDGTAVDYSYDPLNRMVAVASGGLSTGYAYDPASNEVSTTLPSGNGYVETRSYDRAGRLTGVKNQKGATVLADIVVTRDPVGNPLTETKTGATATTFTYGYDNLDRLTSVCFQAGTCPAGSDPFVRWAYDGVGNRLTEQRPTGTTSYAYDQMDRLLSAGATSYTYDRNGNQLSAGTRTFGWDLANRVKTTTSGNTTTTYAYDGDGTRLQASTGTQAAKKTNFLWDVNGGLAQLVRESDGAGALLRRYVYGLRRVSQTAGSTTSFYHYDPLGSVRNLTSQTGATQWTYDYEPYGITRTETKAQGTQPSNLVKFTGEYQDPTGLYHLRARQYDPTAGRFLSIDPAGQTAGGSAITAYAYTGNRPTLMIDPSGETFRPSGLAQSFAENASSSSSGYSLLVLGRPGSCPTPRYWDPETGRCHPFNAGTVEPPFLKVPRLAARAATGLRGIIRIIRGGKTAAKAGRGALDEAGLTLRTDVQLSGGRGGGAVKTLTGPPNSIVRGAPGRIYQTDSEGRVIADITAGRVKPVTPGRGFGPKRPPTPQELEWLRRAGG